MTTVVANPYEALGARKVKPAADNPYEALGARRVSQAEPAARPEPRPDFSQWKDEPFDAGAEFAKWTTSEPPESKIELRDITLAEREADLNQVLDQKIQELQQWEASEPSGPMAAAQNFSASAWGMANFVRNLDLESRLKYAVELQAKQMQQRGDLPPEILADPKLVETEAVLRLGIDQDKAAELGVGYSSGRLADTRRPVAPPTTELPPDSLLGLMEPQYQGERVSPEARVGAKEAQVAQMSYPRGAPESKAPEYSPRWFWDQGWRTAGNLPVPVAIALAARKGLGPLGVSGPTADMLAFAGMAGAQGGTPEDIAKAAIFGRSMGAAKTVPGQMATSALVAGNLYGPREAVEMGLIPGAMALPRLPGAIRSGLANRAMQAAQRQMIANRPLAMEAGARTLPTGEGTPMLPMPEAEPGPYVPLGIRSPTPIRPRIGTDLPPGARAAELRQRMAEAEEMGLIPRGPIQEPGTAELAELQRMGLVPTAPGEAPPPFAPEAPAAKPKGRRGKGKPAPEKPKPPAMPASEAPRVRQPPPEPQRTVKQRMAGLEALHQIRQGKSLREIGYPTEETSDATWVRENAGQVQKPGDVGEAGTGEGRADLERGAPGQPGRAEAQRAEEEVAEVSPVKLAEVTGHVPERSPQAVGAVAGGEAMPDVVGKLNPWGEAARTKRAGKKEARKILAERRGAIGVASENAVALRKSFRKLEKGGQVKTAEARYAIWEGLTGKKPIETFDRPVQDWIRHARKRQDAASKALIRELLYASGGEETPMTESTRRNIGQYVHESLIPKGPIEALRGLTSRKVKLREEQFRFKRDKWAVRIGRSHYKFDTEAEARDFYSAALNQQKAAVITKHAKARGVSPSDLLAAAAKTKPKLLKPLTEPERIEMGFARDPVYTISNSYMKTVTNVETLKAFRRLDESFSQQPPEDVAVGGDKAIEAWAKENGLRQVKGDPKKLGVLAGKWLPKHVAKDVNELTRAPELAERIWTTYLSAWKASHTTWSPPTHVRNLLGNVLFSDFAGCPVYDPRNAKYYLQAVKEIWGKGKAYRTLMKHGVIGTEWYGTEVKPMINRMQTGATPDLALAELGKKLHHNAGRLYNAEDQVYKIATYLRYVDRGRRFILKRPMTPQQAIAEVNRWYPNYKELFGTTKWLSRVPMAGPFIAFNEQAMRIGGRAAIRRPWKIAKWVTLPGAISAINVMRLGITDDELKTINDRRSYFEVIWGRDSKGRVTTLDLRYIFPLANELEGIYNAVAGNDKKVVIPFLLQQPFFSTITDLTYNQDLYTGRQVWKDSDPPATKLRKGVLHAVKEVTPYPSTLTWGRERIQNAITGESDEHVVQAIGAALFGINIKSAYVNRKDAFERVKAVAMEDPAVKEAMDKLLGGDINKWDYEALSEDLETNERFQSLLDLYNNVYRRIEWPGEPERPGQKEITPRGVVQSIRTKEAKPDESVERVGLRKRFRERLSELRGRVKDEKKRNPLTTDERREWRLLERMAARVGSIEAKIKRGKGTAGGERLYETRQATIDKWMRKGLGEE